MEKGPAFRHSVPDPNPMYGLRRRHTLVHAGPRQNVEETRPIHDIRHRCFRVPYLDGLVICYSASSTHEKFKFRPQ
jgi:hypothetical protein